MTHQKHKVHINQVEFQRKTIDIKSSYVATKAKHPFFSYKEEVPNWKTYIQGNVWVVALFSFTITVKSAYKESAYKERPVIGNWFSFPNLYQ